jgi:spore coat protein U-like protein
VKTIVRIALALALAAVAAPALAQTATGSFTVNASVAATCRSVTTSNLNFGAYVPTAASQTTSTISFFCTAGTPWTVTLSTGANNAAAVASGFNTTRAMRGLTDNTQYLAYELYTATTRAAAEAWANSTSGAATTFVGRNGAGSTGDSVTVFGEIPAGQYPGPQSYQDTITATVNY